MTYVEYAFPFLSHFWILILYVKFSRNWLDGNWIALCAWDYRSSLWDYRCLKNTVVTITFQEGLHRFMFTQHLVCDHNVSGAAISIAPSLK